MTESEAQDALQDIKLVQVALAPMQDIKRMRLQCLNAEIAAVMKRPECKSG